MAAEMTESEGLAKLAEVEKELDAQKEIVRSMKAQKAPKAEIDVAVKKLQELKKAQEALIKAHSKPAFDRAQFEDTLKRRFFIAPSFQIYGGVAGLYDFGPAGCSLKANFLQLWREWFVIEESMLEVDCVNVTPDVVLRASGHVEKFSDLMVKDVVTHDCYRADKLLEETMDKKIAESTNEAQRSEYRKIKAQADAYSVEEIHAKIQEFQIKATDTGNDLSEPFPFNLMFQTSIGPKGDTPGFLRPETAQGIFVNFKRLLEFNQGRLPFAAAQIGKAFRNEIAPRAGLLRVREFEMCEIEHFVRADDKSHPKFDTLKDTVLTFFGRDAQLGDGKTVRMTIGEAVATGFVNNQTLGYFMTRTHLLLRKIGLHDDRIRFRQHLATEMAHYATDCWDAELETSYGWVECVGHADRACYDLRVHSASSKVDLTAYEEYETPQSVDCVLPTVNKGSLGKTLRKEAGPVIEALIKLAEEKPEEAMALHDKLQAEGTASIAVAGKDYALTKDQLSYRRETKKIHGRTYHPSVIEPSFGVGRIIYSLLEQSYWVRKGDEQRTVFSLPAVVAPFKLVILPLSGNKEFAPFIAEFERKVRFASISCRVDDSSAAIGRRYARQDELGIPFAVTVDFDTCKDSSVTLRERDSTQQIRLSMDEAVELLQGLVRDTTTWAEARAKFPHVTVKED